MSDHVPIADRTIELEGRTYTWSYDSETLNPNSCWRWSDEGFMEPSGAMRIKLNRHFILQHAKEMLAALPPMEHSRFAGVLRAMGATNDDLATLGLWDYLTKHDFPYVLKRIFENLPAAGHGPFNSAVVRDWFFNSIPVSPHRHSYVLIGFGPFPQDNMRDFLRGRGIACGDGRTGNVILGREGWTAKEIDDVIDRHVGHCLRVYSQEMFLAFLATLADPFIAHEFVLTALRAGHPGLLHVSQGWPGWVKTYVHADRALRSGGEVDFHVDESPIHVMGYKVGKSGATLSERRDILEKAFREELPPVGTPGYMLAWGGPSSAERLWRIAEQLAMCIRNNVNRPAFGQAVSDWDQDLAWLKLMFYHGHFRFSWPETFVRP